MNEQEALRRFFEILNRHTSTITGWPLHRLVRTKKGGARRWRSSIERHDSYMHRRFYATGILRANLDRRDFRDDGLVSYEDYYRDYCKGEGSFTSAVRRDFLIKALTLGFIPQ